MNTKITLPNLITLSRFVLVPIFLYQFYIKNFLIALLLLVITGLTDFFDGWIARKFHQRSRLGSMLDPLADKYLMLLSFLYLGWIELLPDYLIGVIIGRDIGIVLGVVLLTYVFKRKLYYKPTILSKLTTTSQILLLVVAFFMAFLENQEGFGYFSARVYTSYVLNFLIYLALTITILTAGQYAYIAYKFLRYGEKLK